MFQNYNTVFAVELVLSKELGSNLYSIGRENCNLSEMDVVLGIVKVTIQT